MNHLGEEIRVGWVGPYDGTMASLTSAVTDFIHRQRIARLATVDASGNPHAVPICYAFDGKSFYSAIDGKSKWVGDRGLRLDVAHAAHPVSSW